jgi:hypothetical protein
MCSRSWYDSNEGVQGPVDEGPPTAVAGKLCFSCVIRGLKTLSDALQAEADIAVKYGSM